MKWLHTPAAMRVRTLCALALALVHLGCGGESERIPGVWGLDEADVLRAAEKIDAAARAADAKIRAEPNEGMRSMLRLLSPAPLPKEAIAAELRTWRMTFKPDGGAILELAPAPRSEGRWVRTGLGLYRIDVDQRKEGGAFSHIRVRLQEETLEVLGGSGESDDPKMRGESDIDPSSPMQRWKRRLQD